MGFAHFFAELSSTPLGLASFFGAEELVECAGFRF